MTELKETIVILLSDMIKGAIEGVFIGLVVGLVILIASIVYLICRWKDRG